MSVNKPQERYYYGPYEGYEVRCQRRIKNDLGVDEEAVETILHLRRQVVELKSHIRRLESELTAQVMSQNMRLALYREVYIEASWIDMEIQK
jgi:hypothetical protein